MSDSDPPRLPAPARLPTTRPAPTDDDPIELMRELRKALANVGELCARLDTTLACHELAILTSEHKVNTAHDAVAELRARLGRIEIKLSMAAE